MEHICNLPWKNKLNSVWPSGAPVLLTNGLNLAPPNRINWILVGCKSVCLLAFAIDKFLPYRMGFALVSLYESIEENMRN